MSIGDMGMIRDERRLRRDVSLTGKEGDPGKRIDAWVPTPLWKRLTETAAARDITLGHAAALALSEWALKENLYGPPSSQPAPCPQVDRPEPCPSPRRGFA